MDNSVHTALLHNKNSGIHTVLPIVLGCITAFLLFTFLFDPNTLKALLKEEEILNSSTIEAILSHEYRYSIFACIGMMIPFITDQLCTFSTAVDTGTSSTLAARIDPYIVPFLVTITQLYNICYITEERTIARFWWYYQGTAMQFIVVFAVFLTTQAIYAEKYPKIQRAVSLSSLCINIAILCKVANFLTLGPRQKMFFCFASLAYAGTIISNTYIAYKRLQNYRKYCNIDMKEAKMELYNFFKINVMSIGVLGYVIMDYNYLPNQFVSNYTKESAVGMNMVLIVLIYGYIEIQYMRKRDLAKFSIVSLLLFLLFLLQQ